MIIAMRDDSTRLVSSDRGDDAATAIESIGVELESDAAARATIINGAAHVHAVLTTVTTATTAHHSMPIPVPLSTLQCDYVAID